MSVSLARCGSARDCSLTGPDAKRPRLPSSSAGSAIFGSASRLIFPGPGIGRPADDRGPADLYRWVVRARLPNLRRLRPDPLMLDRALAVLLTRILQKLGLRDRIQTVIYAYETGLIAPGMTAAGDQPAG